MERDQLKKIGLDDDQVERVMEAYGKSVSSHITSRDDYKSQLDAALVKLQSFEGVDIEALQGEIAKLKKDMSANEAKYLADIANRDFQSVLSAEIAAAGGRNEKAIIALLDTEALKNSENPKDAAAAAVRALSASEAYLFGSSTTNATPAKVSSGATHSDTGSGQLSTNAQMNALITGKIKGE